MSSTLTVETLSKGHGFDTRWHPCPSRTRHSACRDDIAGSAVDRLQALRRQSRRQERQRQPTFTRSRLNGVGGGSVENLTRV